MSFTDIHIHLLCGVDDGAENEEQMRKMLDAAYRDGTRAVCATPHYHPGYFEEKPEAADDAFRKLQRYAEKYPDMKLYRGNELRYGRGFDEWIKSGSCMSLNGSRYLLVDFLEYDDADYIVDSVLRVLNTGYIPVLAHAERYEGFGRDLEEIERLSSCGVVIQVDALSPFGGWGRGAKRRSRRIIECGLADVIASDAHDAEQRSPRLNECFEYVKDRCGIEYADCLFTTNPALILADMEIRKDTEL